MSSPTVPAFSIGGWTIGPWSADIVASMAFAYLERTGAIIVVLAGNAVALSQITPGDALNPDSWQVQDEIAGSNLTVSGVTMLQASNVFALQLLQDVNDAYHTYIVDGAGVLSAFGSSFLTTPVAYVINGGVPELTSIQSSGVPHDLATLPAAESLGGEVVGMTGRGGYSQVSGVDLLKKAIYRRLTTMPGSYFHLKDYGLGLAYKSLIRPADLPNLQQRIINQVKLEPEVESVSVKLGLSSANVLTITLNVKAFSMGQLAPWQVFVQGGS